MGTASMTKDLIYADENFAEAQKWDQFCLDKLDRDKQKTLQRAEAYQKFVEQVKSGRIQMPTSCALDSYGKQKKPSIQTVRSSQENVQKLQIPIPQPRNLDSPNCKLELQAVSQFNAPVLQLTKASSNIYDVSSSSINESDIGDDLRPGNAEDARKAFVGLKLVDFIVRE